MAEMTEQVSVLLPVDQAAWLRNEAKRIERPISFVMRKLLLREQLNRSVDATTDIHDVRRSDAAGGPSHGRRNPAFADDRQPRRRHSVCRPARVAAGLTVG